MQLTKIAVLLSLVSTIGLTACQNQTTTERNRSDAMSRQGDMGRDAKDGPRRDFKNMTEEERAALKEQMQQRRANHQALNDACKDKAGQTLSMKVGEQTVTGQCEVHFRPDRPSKGESDMPHHGGMMHDFKDGAERGFRDFKNMTEEERAALQQKMQQRKDARDALDQACQGKIGQTLDMKLDDKTVTGQCEVMFRPDRPANAPDTPPAPPMDKN